MNTVVVVAANDSLCYESMASIHDAAQRWNAMLDVVTGAESPLHPACWKLLVFERPNIDRVMIIDADTLIHGSCPNPFDEFPEHQLTVVTDRQTHQPHRDKAETDEWECVTGIRFKPTNFFNTGMMVASRAHQLLFAEAFSICEKFPTLSWHDQTPLNVVMQDHPELVNYTDQSWNFHNPNLRLPNWRQMQKNIYHFPGNPDRMRLIPEVQWR